MRYNRFGFQSNKYNVGSTVPGILPTFNVSYSLDNTYDNQADFDATNVTITVTTDPAITYNAFYRIESKSGNVVTSDFTDNALTGNLNIVNGNATITKQLSQSLTSDGNKVFSFHVDRDQSNNSLAESSNIFIFEIDPIIATGGNITTTEKITTSTVFPYPRYIQKARIHDFTNNTSTQTFTITNTGNYVGNANLWINLFSSPTTGSSSQWGQRSISNADVSYRVLGIGGGGGAGWHNIITYSAQGGYSQSGGFGGGGGQVGIKRLPLSNLSATSYSLTVGSGGNVSQYTTNTSSIGNTIIFAGTSQELKAVGGGRGGVSPNANNPVGSFEAGDGAGGGGKGGFCQGGSVIDNSPLWSDGTDANVSHVGADGGDCPMATFNSGLFDTMIGGEGVNLSLAPGGVPGPGSGTTQTVVYWDLNPLSNFTVSDLSTPGNLNVGVGGGAYISSDFPSPIFPHQAGPGGISGGTLQGGGYYSDAVPNTGAGATSNSGTQTPNAAASGRITIKYPYIAQGRILANIDLNSTLVNP